MDYKAELLSIYDAFPFCMHPFWVAVRNHTLSLEQILAGEVQHYLRTKRGQIVRGEALASAKNVSETLFEELLETYFEECDEEQAGPSHLQLIERLLLEGGMSEEELLEAECAPGNIAAIALYEDIAARGAACHIIGAGVIEYFYAELAPTVFESYVNRYHMTEWQAETYRIHGPMDKVHANRAFDVLPEAIDRHGWGEIRRAVRDAFVATCLHYDGMMQAATGEVNYWDRGLL